MKTIKQIITVVALVIFMLGSLNINAQAKVGKPVPSKAAVGWFSAGVYGCWGWNFCDGGAPWERPAEKSSNNSIQTLLKKGEKFSMTFEIPLSSMSEENRKFYSKAKVFVLEDDKVIDTNERKEFGLNNGVVYKKGMYDLINDGNKIIFTVDIR